MSNDIKDIKCSRKLHEDEILCLRTELLDELKAGEEGKSDEDENLVDLLDFVLAMVGNGKTVEYIVNELTSMEMEECDKNKSKRVGEMIAEFIIKNVLEADKNVEIAEKLENREEERLEEDKKNLNAVENNDIGHHMKTKSNDDVTESSKPRFKSLVKPMSSKENALTASGALDSVIKKQKGNAPHKSGVVSSTRISTPKTKTDAPASTKGRGKPTSHRNDRPTETEQAKVSQRQRPSKQQRAQQDPINTNGNGKGGGRISRSVTSAAFKRLTNQNGGLDKRGMRNIHSGPLPRVAAPPPPPPPPNRDQRHKQAQQHHQTQNHAPPLMGGRRIGNMRGGIRGGRGGGGRHGNMNGRGGNLQSEPIVHNQTKRTQIKNISQGPGGHRRYREVNDEAEVDFIPAVAMQEDNFCSNESNRGRGNQRIIRKFHGRGQGERAMNNKRMRVQPQHTNHVRTNDYTNNIDGNFQERTTEQNYSTTDANFYEEGNFGINVTPEIQMGGGRFHGGRGRISGRGFNGRGRGRHVVSSQSPLINSTFTVASSYGSESTTSATTNMVWSRGGGRIVGSGRTLSGFGRTSIPGRSTVKGMIAAKVWIRPRTMEEGLGTKR